MHVDDALALEELDERLRVLLPETYQDSFESLEPTPMGSAALKYGPDGKVAWDQIWGSFCDLAMAGGPPHKGTLLEPGGREAIDAEPARYEEVVDEICRGISLASELPAQGSARPGWVSVDCYSETMASWLLRAIVMENVSARVTAASCSCRPLRLFVSRRKSRTSSRSSPRRRITGWATCPGRRRAPSRSCSRRCRPRRSSSSPPIEDGWRGVDCASVKAAVWLMRAMVVNNVLSRREGTTLFVPKNPASDPGGVIVARTVMLAHRLAAMRDVG